MRLLPSLLVALVFAGVHVFGPAMQFLRVEPRSAWLSLAGGVSVAYVFVHLLPELAGHQQTLSGLGGGAAVAGIERHVYVVALAGLAIFYGLDRLVRGPAARAWAAGASFWLHLGAFALYNLLIGYLLLHREERDPRGLVIYAVAMGLHFVVNDQGLRESHGAAYDAKGRWLLAAAPPLGWLLGLAVALPPLAIASLFAFLAGGVVLNVLKEELPEERESRYWAFLLGTAGYASLLLATR